MHSKTFWGIYKAYGKKWIKCFLEFLRKTIKKFVNLGMLKDLKDIFYLYQYRQQLIQMEGFGDKLYQNLITEIEKCKEDNV